MSGSRNPNPAATAAPQDQSSTEAWRKNLGRTVTHLGLPRWEEWWTGLAPDFCQGYEQGKLHSIMIPNLATCTRQSVLDYFNNTWTLNELLFSSLIGEEAFYRPPYHALRHPFIFYYGHPAVLYVNKLRLAGLLPDQIDQYFESIFEVGVDEMSWDDMSKNLMEWPSVDDVLQYRRQVYAAIKRLIETHPGLAEGHQPINQEHPLWALFMGFEHERIHIETSSVLIRELPLDLVARPQEWPDMAPLVPVIKRLPESKSDAGAESNDRFPPKAGRDYPVNEFVSVEGREVRIGKPLDWPTYGWDNEYGSRTVQLGDFAASSYLVSNGEYWQFVADGGYNHQDHWTETGWAWRSFRNVKHPTFWMQEGSPCSHQYRLRTCFDEVPMQWNWPVVVNFHEAKAFSRWKSDKEGKTYRLVTEAEHNAMRRASHFDSSDVSQLIPPAPFNTNLAMGSECAVDLARSGTSGDFYDMFGNLWQWCEDHFNSLDGFAIHRFYEDFSTPCFDAEHQMILGGSFVSTGAESTHWARFHFRPHFFQHAGIRLVEAKDGADGAVIHLHPSK